MPLLITKHAVRLNDEEGHDIRLPYSPEQPIEVPAWVLKHPEFPALETSGALKEVFSPLIIPVGFKQILVPLDHPDPELIEVATPMKSEKPDPGKAKA